MVVFVILAIIIALAGVAAAGWYMTGIKMVIQTDPGDARIIIDGQEVGRTNQYGALTTGRLRTGTHNIIIRHDGYDEWKQSVTISFTDFSKGMNIKLNATKYKITINSSPSGSEVLIDNASIGTTSYENGTLEIPATLPGEHTVVVRHEGYHEWKQTVTLSGDLKLDVTLNPAPVFDETSGLADDEIKSALQGWAQSTSNRDIDSHMRYYADTLDYYYNQTLVPSSKVREDRMKAFAKYEYMSVQLSNIGIQLDSTGQRATVTLDKAFDFRDDSGSFYSGSVQDQLTVTKLAGGWLITGEKELKVYYVNK